MNTIIEAFAPTVYQLSSLCAFNMPYEKLRDGSFIAKMEFGTIREAREYLRERAKIYNDADPNGSKKRLNEMNRDIWLNHLTLDAVTAHIEKY